MLSDVIMLSAISYPMRYLLPVMHQLHSIHCLPRKCLTGEMMKAYFDLQVQEALLDVVWGLDEQALPGCAAGLGDLVCFQSILPWFEWCAFCHAQQHNAGGRRMQAWVMLGTYAGRHNQSVVCIYSQGLDSCSCTTRNKGCTHMLVQTKSPVEAMSPVACLWRGDGQAGNQSGS